MFRGYFYSILEGIVFHNQGYTFIPDNKPVINRVVLFYKHHAVVMQGVIAEHRQIIMQYKFAVIGFCQMIN